MVVGYSRQVDMTNMVVCDESIRLFLSSPYPVSSTLTPELGQRVTLSAAVASGDTSVTVEPLTENIASGTVLDFNGTSVTTTAPAYYQDTTIQVSDPAAAIAQYTTATTSGVEQTLTLGNAVAAGDKTITLASALTSFVEAGRTITFEPSGIQVRTKYKTPVGATTIAVEDAEFAIPAGETASLYNFLEVLSINTLDDSSSANTINERNYKSGTGTGKAVTSYNDTISISGNYIKNDMALFRLYNMKSDPTLRGYLLKAVIFEPEGGQQQFGTVWLGQSGNQRPNDQTKKISATLEVDGLLKNCWYPLDLLA